jgi:hypothetical protein
MAGWPGQGRERRLDSRRSASAFGSAAGSLACPRRALALQARINRTYIGSLEVGDRNPSLDNPAKLAKALRCDLADLVTGLQDLAGRADYGKPGSRKAR